MYRLNSIARFVMLGLALFAFNATDVFSQQSQTPPKVLKPKMAISEVAFAVTLLESVEIRGNEVDAFVDVKGVLMKLIDKATADKKKATDEVVVEINIAQAQNLLALLQRARLTGSDAERYKKFVDTVVESSK